MLKKVAIAVVLLVAAVLGFAATRPGSLHVERSERIDAPPETIFPIINDLRAFGTWSPYEKLDPEMKRTLGGPASGIGSTYEWDGDNNVGAGRMEIVESTPPSKVAMKLDFIRPFEGHNTATFTVAPDGGGSRVTWAMDGPSPYIQKLMGMFFNMETMIGDQFAEGLANLKRLAEARPVATSTAPN